ncbi:MAG: ParB/RepB/Spo0J family partition protein [Candidatus Omnitrophica bacterium]|nr:ParB/RepB/Spo0J family partition protein [Candidatus Omnitrophota bacterium]
MEIKEIRIKDIEIIDNHRTNIADTRIDELMMSIKQHGLKQPIGVTVGKKKKYQIIYGQRRFLAFQKLGWETIPAEIQKINDKQFHILSLTENIQRDNPSFNELGRSMDALEKLGLNTKEIAVRLGIPLDRVKQIIRTYQALPEKHRDKVKFGCRGGGRGKGDIPPQVANKILTIKKENGLSNKDCDSLFKYVQETDMLVEDLRNLAILLKTGMSIAEAIEALHEVFVYTVSVVVDRTEVYKRMKDEGITSKQTFFRRMIYGKTPPVKKPKFIKV